MTRPYLMLAALAALAAAVGAWLLGRAALQGLRRFVRNLWPH